MTSHDIDQMPLSELRRLLDEAEASGAPGHATFSVSRLNRGAMMLSWDEPSGSGNLQGLHLARRCTCDHPECPDRT